MRWSNDYKIGIAAVDAQHKRLFEMVAELDEALQAGLKPTVIKELLVGLEQYKTRHFQLEEKYMHEVDYPGTAEQQEAHRSFTQQFTEIRGAFEQDGLTPAIVNTIRNELSAWLKDHVTGLDQQFGKYYKSHKS